MPPRVTGAPTDACSRLEMVMVSLLQGLGIGVGGWKAEADARRLPLGAAAARRRLTSQESSSMASSAALVSSKNRSLWAIRIARDLLRKLEVPRENSANASPVPWAVAA